MGNYSETNYKLTLTPMAKRLGRKDFQQPNSLPLKRPHRDFSGKEQTDGTPIVALDNQRMRLRAMGGNAQQERMIVLHDIKQSPFSFLSKINMIANKTIDIISPIILNVISCPPFPYKNHISISSNRT